MHLACDADAVHMNMIQTPWDNALLYAMLMPCTCQLALAEAKQAAAEAHLQAVYRLCESLGL